MFVYKKSSNKSESIAARRVLYMITLRFGPLWAFVISYGQELQGLSPQKFI